jgi:hypothetical protein
MAKDFDPKRVIVTFKGARMKGFMAGTYIMAEHANDAFTTTIGSDGEGTRTRSHDESGTVVLTLQAESPSNGVLSNALAADKIATGAGKGPLSIDDLNGNTLVAAAEAWVQKSASVEISNEASGREWTLATANLQITVGGAI